MPCHLQLEGHGRGNFAVSPNVIFFAHFVDCCHEMQIIVSIISREAIGLLIIIHSNELHLRRMILPQLLSVFFLSRNLIRGTLFLPLDSNEDDLRNLISWALESRSSSSAAAAVASQTLEWKEEKEKLPTKKTVLTPSSLFTITIIVHLLVVPRAGYQHHPHPPLDPSPRHGWKKIGKKRFPKKLIV